MPLQFCVNKKSFECDIALSITSDKIKKGLFTRMQWRPSSKIKKTQNTWMIASYLIENGYRFAPRVPRRFYQPCCEI